MEPLMFVMAILGCGESDAACREIGVAPARYESQATCLAATEDVLSRQDDPRYPTIVAQCRPAGAARQLLRGTDVRTPEPPYWAIPRQRFASR